MLHRNVPLPTHRFASTLRTTLELTASQTDCLADNRPRFNYTYHTGHRYTADTYHARIIAEYILRTHSCDFRIAISAHQRDNHPPHKQRTGTDDKRIAQTYDIPETKHSRTRVATHHKFGLLGNRLAPGTGSCLQCPRPETESFHNVVINTTDKRSNYQRLGL